MERQIEMGGEGINKMRAGVDVLILIAIHPVLMQLFRTATYNQHLLSLSVTDMCLSHATLLVVQKMASQGLRHN